MPITIDGTNGISDVRSTTDGSAATPAIRGTDANTGIFFPAEDTIAFAEGGAESARFNSAGNLGIGTTSPSYKLDVNDVARVSGLRQSFQTGLFNVDGALSNYSATNGVYLNGNATGWLRLSGDGTNNSSASIQLNGGSYGESKLIVFSTNNAERMRIDSTGNLLVGTTTVTSQGWVQLTTSNTKYSIVSRSSVSGAGAPLSCVNSAGTEVGSITFNNTTTTYATSSDYRLKENIAPMTGALGLVQQLKPVTYNWKVDGSSSQGFIAHELQEVVPDCVTGEKDAVDSEGNPQYQGIDTSFLVATLTAAIQELKATVDAQAARIAALENPPAEI
jgi:hypothetical protein